MLLLSGNQCFSQDKKTTDSLVAELKKFEAKQAALGNSANEMADTIKADLLSELAIAHYKNNPDKAFSYAKEQLSISQRIGYKWGVANAIDIQANIYDHKGEYDRALKLFLEARILYGEIGRKLDVLNMDNSIGVLYSKKGLYNEGLKYLFKALNMAKKENDYWSLVGTYNNIGIIYKNHNEADDALKYYFECLKMQLKDDKQYAISHTYNNIGDIYRDKKQAAVALKYFNLGLKSAQNEQDNISLANNYSSIGTVYIDIKDYEKALQNHLTALNIRRNTEDGFGLFTSYLALGNIYLNTGNSSRALEYTQKALDQVKGRGELDNQVQAYDQLSKIYAAQGNYKLAYDNHLLYKQLNDSVFNDENQKKLTQQKMEFDFKIIQEKKDLLAKHDLQTQKNIRNFTITALAIIALLIILMLVRRHKRISALKQKAYNEDINELHEELSIKEFEAQALKVEKENVELKNNLIAIEREYEKGEKEKLQEKLDFNRRELASATMYLFQKNELLSGLKTEIDALPANSVQPKLLDKIKSTIQQNLYLDADWDKFKLHFEQVHPSFFTELNERHPGLTAYEVRLYAYLHIKLSTKEIAGLLNITPASVTKAKVRLNKKLNLTDNSNNQADVA